MKSHTLISIKCNRIAFIKMNLAKNILALENISLVPKKDPYLNNLEQNVIYTQISENRVVKSVFSFQVDSIVEEGSTQLNEIKIAIAKTIAEETSFNPLFIEEIKVEQIISKTFTTSLS